MSPRPCVRVSIAVAASLLLAACAPRAPEATARASAGAAADAKPRLTGGPQPAIAAGPLQYLASGPSPLAVGCEGGATSGTAYIGAEVEPHLAVDPSDPRRLAAIWQQDRWSNGSARALVAAWSNDGGRAWTRVALPFSRCGGGTALNGGDYERATDPWLAWSPDGTVHAMSLSTNGGVFTTGSRNAMLASRSTDGGRTWSSPVPLIIDGASAFNDKNAMTADPSDGRYVYAVWDRLIAATDRGPAMFTRTTDGGLTWEAARTLFDPGSGNQTIGNLIAVSQAGTLLNLFTQIDRPAGGLERARIAVMRSTDRGATWSAPVYIADLLAVGASDPDTGTAIRDGSIIPTIAAGRDGRVYVAWQDARFSGGARDAIAIARSDDDGRTWGAPVRVSGDPRVPAFTPVVQVAPDGSVGVLYHDLRNNTALPTLPTDVWLARSDDGGATWRDLHIDGPFDLAQAPYANGLFLGDYAGLVIAEDRFLPLFTRVNDGIAGNRTDVVALRLDHARWPATAPKTAADLARDTAARMAPAGYVPSPQHRQRVHALLVKRVKRPPAGGRIAPGGWPSSGRVRW